MHTLLIKTFSATCCKFVKAVLLQFFSEPNHEQGQGKAMLVRILQAHIPSAGSIRRRNCQSRWAIGSNVTSPRLGNGLLQSTPFGCCRLAAAGNDIERGHWRATTSRSSSARCCTARPERPRRQTRTLRSPRGKTIEQRAPPQISRHV